MGYFSRVYQNFPVNSGIIDKVLSLGSSYYIQKTPNTSMNTKSTPTVIGIDLGASTTKIAAVQRGAIDIVTNEANFRETPSVVGYGEGERKIGESGNVKLKSNFKNSLVSPLRYLNLQEGTEGAQKELAFTFCPTVFEGKDLKFKLNYNGTSDKFVPEQILGSYFSQLSSIIQHNGLDQKMIVISVPSYFTQAEKKAVLAAAEIADLKNVRLVSEAIATGLDYGGFKKNEMGDGKNVLFIDFGHSKLSASLVRFTETNMEILAEKHNRNLGCRDIDMKVFERLAAVFKQKTGLDLNENKKACLKLMEIIQKQRKILTGINETDIVIECLMEDQDINEPISRDSMKADASSVFEEIKTLLEDLKEQISKLELPIDSVQLVGGGSRIPEVISIISDIFQMKPSRTTNSSETIARGATLAAVQQSGLFRFHSYKIVNKNSMPIKASWKIIENESEMEAEDFPALQTSTIFDMSEPTPSEKELKIKGKGKVQVLVAYDILEDCKDRKIMEISFNLEEDMEANIVFQQDENNFVSVKRILNESDKKPIQHTVVEFGVLPSKEVSEMKKKERQMFVRDFEIVQGYEKKNSLEAAIYKEKQLLENSKEIAELLGQEEIIKTTAELDKIVNQITDESSSFGIKDYELKAKEVKEIVGQLQAKAEQKKKEKSLAEGYFAELEKLKNQSIECINYMTQNFRNSRSIAQIYDEIKNIHDWTEEVIKVSRAKPASELPLVSKKDIQTQHSNLQYYMNQLSRMRPQTTMNSPRYQQPQQPRRQQQQQPSFDFFGGNNGFFGGMPRRNNYFGNMSGFF